MAGTTTTDYVEAFLRNCPHVRLTKEEREELWRLFQVCRRDAMRKMAADIQHDMKSA